MTTQSSSEKISDPMTIEINRPVAGLVGFFMKIIQEIIDVILEFLFEVKSYSALNVYNEDRIKLEQ